MEACISVLNSVESPMRCVCSRFCRSVCLEVCCFVMVPGPSGREHLLAHWSSSRGLPLAGLLSDYFCHAPVRATVAGSFPPQSEHIPDLIGCNHIALDPFINIFHPQLWDGKKLMFYLNWVGSPVQHPNTSVRPLVNQCCLAAPTTFSIKCSAHVLCQPCLVTLAHICADDAV